MVDKQRRAPTPSAGKAKTAPKAGARKPRADASPPAPPGAVAPPVHEATPATTPVPDSQVGGARDISIGTDAVYADLTEHNSPGSLRNISEVRHFFRTNRVPIYFVGASPLNLLGLDRWVRNFSYITYYDGWDGAHPRVFSPKNKPYQEFTSSEEINNWLLRNGEVRARMTRGLAPGVRPKVAMVFFNEETEDICRELGYDLILPPAALRERLDSKIVTTELGNCAGVASVPNVLTEVSTYEALLARAEEAGLGDDLVLQTAYGDSGKTTYFVSNEDGWNRCCEEVAGEQIKVMRRINNRPIAIEAVITRSGTVVGPFLTELTGYPELTPYKGGWCGNEMLPAVVSTTQRKKAIDLVRRLGDRLDHQEGYRGFFEVDVLVDTDSDEVYLGELNPRISGASAITNVTAGAYADVPLFLFHLLEFLDVDFVLDVDDINERWERLSGSDAWSQMVIKETAPIVEQITAAPATGQYYLDDTGALTFRRAALDWHQLQNESEAFYLRIYAAGDYRWQGADLGVLVTKGPLQTDARGATDLSIRAQDFIDAIRAQYAGTPLPAQEADAAVHTAGVKSL